MVKSEQLQNEEKHGKTLLIGATVINYGGQFNVDTSFWEPMHVPANRCSIAVDICR